MSYFLLLVLVIFIIYFAWEMKRSLHRSSVTNELVQRYAEKSLSTEEQRELIAAIYAYCASDWKLKRIIRRYGATEEDFLKIYGRLRVWGNIRKRRRYVPISSFFYVYTLEYLLKHPEEDEKKMALKCLKFFHM